MPRHLARLLVAAMLVSLLPATALAQPAPDPTDGSDRGPDAVETGTMRDPAAPPAEQFATPLADAAARARTFAAVDCPLSIYPDDPADVSIAIGVTPYHDIAPRLCDVEGSDRISLEVIGTSAQGRELPLVVVTSPETPEQAERNDELTRLMVDDPEAAAALLDDGGYDDYKPTLMHNGNIHGNEWEGTDYSLDIIEYLADAPADAPIVEDTTGLSTEEVDALPTVGEVLAEFRIVFIPTSNPDGRVLGRRQNDRFIDMNRDHITQSQPETVARVQAMIEHQPLLFLDHHGYVNNASRGLLGLIEPTTPPHGEAYEYDLYLPSALRFALDAEEDILRRRDAGGLSLFTTDNVRIPYRDDAEGWDDWPPIFTPMYAMYHAAVGATIEFPFNPRATSLSAEERAERVENNIEFGRAVADTMHVNGYAHRDVLVANQIEWFRRGAAGEPTTYGELPDEAFDPILGLWGEEDVYPTEYPRAYVIPVGADQASDVAAARLARFLQDNDVRVSSLTADTELDGRTYDAGSYVVDMHQAKRGLAHTILDEGTDVSDRVDAMYDISGWSLGLLWGADVVDVDDDAFTDAVEDADPSAGGVEGGTALGYALSLTSEEEIAALTSLWRAGVPLQRSADGTVLVPASARDLLVELADELDVPFARITSLPAGRTELPPLRIGAAIGNTGVLGQSTLLLLTEALGLDVERLSRDEIRSRDLGDIDVLLFAEDDVRWSQPPTSTGSSEDPRNLGYGGQQALRDFTAAGGGIVTYGRDAALNLVEPSGLVAGLDATGSRTDANGVLSVMTEPGSDVLPDRAVEGAAFGYPVAWFPEPGAATVEQRLGDDPLISGHWRPRLTDDDPPAQVPDQLGQEDAAGQALTISAELAEGGRLVAFGTEPFFRWHPKGLFDEVVDAMLWAADLPATDADLGTPYQALPDRVAGATRIETAVELSRAAYSPGVDTVVVATAYEFADALTSGPLAGAVDGPVLLTPATALPAVVAAELERLEPRRIVIAGGTAAVTAGVEAALEDLAPEVARFFGANRFGTAAALASEYAEPGGTVVLATGQQFADALAGGVLAGRTDSALLLVAGQALPQETAAELERLEPSEVVILGGTGAVSEVVSDAVAALTGVTPRRVFGPDRFGTAAAVAAELDGLDGVEMVLAATGAGYADALAGVPVAIREDGAILLALRDLVPAATAAALASLQPERVVILGGTGVISAATAAALRG